MGGAARTLLVLALVIAPDVSPLTAVTRRGATELRSYRFVNGRWFDGRRFVPRDLYAVDAVFTRRKPARVDEVLDLAGAYAVPPFADAHTHHFDNPANVERHVNMYLAAGVFYAKVQTSVRSRALKVADRVNHPASVDVAYAHGGLTSSYGHPLATYEGLALFRRPAGFDPEETRKVRESRLAENDAYYIIDVPGDLASRWPMILEGKPDFIKIYLLGSEEYEERRERADAVGHRGLDPRLPSLIVERARAAGLRVSAHVQTVMDYRIALDAGVQEIVHVPGAYIRRDDDTAKYELTERDARLTARRQVTVIPAPMAVESLRPESRSFDARAKERTDRVRVRNLNLLKRHGVRFAFGSDRFGSTPVDDVLYLHGLRVFSNAELLRIWCEATPVAIFPARKIGRLAEGYEASFLALGGNPLADFGQVKNIRLRFKQGRPWESKAEESSAETSR